jgi:hypothetical protein
MNNEYIQKEYGGLVGKTIAEVRVLTDKECEIFVWSTTHGNPPFVIIMTDGSVIIPASDPECNDAGYLLVEEVEPCVWLQQSDERLEKLLS